MKVDISKTFDTISWSFMVKVLKAFGPFDKFFHWIIVILEFALNSFSINGVQRGYFHCQRGVRQRDPLSPHLFFLTEGVSSRGITQLINNQKIKLIKTNKNSIFPSHAPMQMTLCYFAKETLKPQKGSVICSPVILVYLASRYTMLSPLFMLVL